LRVAIDELRARLDGRYEEVKNGSSKPIDGEASFEELRGLTVHWGSSEAHPHAATHLDGSIAHKIVAHAPARPHRPRLDSGASMRKRSAMAQAR
jgi:hypothetical protein